MRSTKGPTGFIAESRGSTASFARSGLIRGHHAVEAVWQVPGHIIALGQFDGAGVHGDPRSVGFVDIWAFGAGDCVAERRTFLATGHALVER